MIKSNFLFLAACVLLHVVLQNLVLSAKAHSGELRIWNSEIKRVLDRQSLQGESEYTSLMFENDVVTVSECTVQNRDVSVLESIDKSFKFADCEKVTTTKLAEFENAVFARSGQRIRGSVGSIVWASIKTLGFGYVSVVSFVGTVGTAGIPPIALVTGTILAGSTYLTYQSAKDLYRLGFGVRLDPETTNEVLARFSNRKNRDIVSVIVEDYDSYKSSIFHALKYLPSKKIESLNNEEPEESRAMEFEVQFIAP